MVSWPTPSSASVSRVMAQPNQGVRRPRRIPLKISSHSQLPEHPSFEPPYNIPRPSSPAPCRGPRLQFATSPASPCVRYDSSHLPPERTDTPAIPPSDRAVAL